VRACACVLNGVVLTMNMNETAQRAFYPATQHATCNATRATHTTT
jgi:hypothetical protein